MRRRRQLVPRLALALVGLLMVGTATLLVVVFGGLSHYVADGPAMEPTLPHGTHFLLARTWLVGAPEPGEVAVFADPANGIEIIKRVVAAGGQMVEIRAGQVYVDGQPLGRGETRCPTEFAEERRCDREQLGERFWITTLSPLSAPEDVDPVHVPAGCVYALGDHRDRSTDSRHEGPICAQRFVGTLVLP